MAKERPNVLSHRGVPGTVSKKTIEEIPTSRAEVRRLKRKYADPLKAWKRGRHEQIKKHISDLRAQKKQVSKSASSKIRGHYIDIERAYRQQGKGRLGDLKRGINWIKRLGRPVDDTDVSPPPLPLPPSALPPSFRARGISGRIGTSDSSFGELSSPQQQEQPLSPVSRPSTLNGFQSGPQYALPAPAPARPALPAPQEDVYAVVRPVTRRALPPPASSGPRFITAPRYEPRQLPAPSAVRTIAPITRPDRLLPAPSSVSRPLLAAPLRRGEPNFDTMKRVGPGVPGAWNPITRPDRLLPAAGETTRTSNVYLRLDTLKKRLSGKKTTATAATRMKTKK